MRNSEKRDALIAHYTDEDGLFHGNRAVSEFIDVFYAFAGHDHPYREERRVELAYANGIATGANGNFDGLARRELALYLLWGVFAFGGADDA